MRLTVGPLPAAVYWRRRLLVLGILALTILVVVYACTGGPRADTGEPAGPTRSAPLESASPPGSAAPSSSPSPSPSAFTLPAASPTVLAAPSGACADDEIELTAVASPDTVTTGQPATFTLKIMNISTRLCIRDIGSVPQELQLRQGEEIAWSSDDCSKGDPYNFDQELTPGHELTFDIMWYGYRTRDGTGGVTCAEGAQQKPDAGNYGLVARLGTKFSEPATVSIRSSGA